MPDWKDKITTSLHGRRHGLQRMTTGESGGTSEAEFLVGSDGHRHPTSTSNTTSTNVPPYGVQTLPGTSAGSSSVYTIDPPIPGVEVIIVGSTRAKTYLKTANSEQIRSSQATTDTVVALTSNGDSFRMVGISTAAWASNIGSSASGIVTSTST